MRKAVPFAIAAVGAILFAGGLLGAAAFSAASRAAGEGLGLDCVFTNSPAPDCDARRAVIATNDTLTLASEVALFVGLALLLVAFVLDWRRGKAAARDAARP